MLTLIILTAVVGFLFYYFIVKPFDYWKERGVKQGNPKWIVGDNLATLLRKQSLAELVEEVYKRHPDHRYSGMYQFFSPTLVIRDLDLIKLITVKDFDHFTDHRSIFPEDAEPLWGKNLFSLNGRRWHDMRTVLSPTFTSSKMRAMFTLMTECAENFVQHFLKKDEDILTLDFKDVYTRFTNDVIATTAFGIKVDSLGEPDNNFYVMGRKTTDFSSFWKSLKMFGYFLMPKLFNLLRIKMFSEDVSRFFVEIVNGTIKIREEQGIVRPDMINQLLEARKGIQKQEKEENGLIDTGFSTAQEINLGKPGRLPKDISDMDITAQAMIFFFAGFDGVSNFMCFLTYELTVNPEIQERLREEIRATLEECEGKITYESLLQMKYMDMVISEVLRKWPIGISADRICTKPYTIQPTTPDEKPLHLEKGSLIWLPIFGIHRDPEYFPDPLRFDPERFSDENKGNIKPYTYFPFGLGPRNCIGSRFALLETKIIIFYILQHFEFVPVEKSRIPLKLDRRNFNLIAEGGFWYGLKRISV